MDSGVVVYAASTGGQVSRETERWGNGAFTKALVEGLRGKADYSRTGMITVSSLELLHQLPRQRADPGRTDPTTAKPSTVPDFLIARVPPPDRSTKSLVLGHARRRRRGRGRDQHRLGDRAATQACRDS